MKRRTFAAAASGTLAGLAGCLSQLGGSDDSTTTESQGLSAERDGYPESVDAKPEDRTVDTSGLDTIEEGGVEVPLLPVEDAHVWWAYRRARFADPAAPTSTRTRTSRAPSSVRPRNASGTTTTQ